MARKKKKEVCRVITLDKKFSEEEFKPKCFGCKEDYCLPDLCGVWYSKCSKCKNKECS